MQRLSGIVLVGLVSTVLLAACALEDAAPESAFDLVQIERDRVLALAEGYLDEEPVTVTASIAERSAGGVHDYYSEGDYWWPDPDDPDGPYVRRDGESNPDAFFDHRRSMRRLSLIVPSLAAAYRVTGDCRYAEPAMRHLAAWFVDEAMRMNPNLLYAQAIHGRVTGRGIGIIDTIHLVEVARSVPVLAACPSVDPELVRRVKAWFGEYLDWITTHPYGLAERDNGNNHSTCWAMQVGAFASLVGDEARMDSTRVFFKDVLLPTQMAADGSFPKELSRTKPYGYMLFNLDAFLTVAQILSTPDDDLFAFTLPDGRGLRRAMEFMAPYIADKSTWTYEPDVMYFDEWPVRHPALLFAGLAYQEPDYLDLWRKLDPDPTVDEIVRNFPIRQPILWIDRTGRD